MSRSMAPQGGRAAGGVVVVFPRPLVFSAFGGVVVFLVEVLQKTWFCLRFFLLVFDDFLVVF